MTRTADFIAADLGASSGRLIAGRWDGRSFSLDELYRFPNGGMRVADSLHWDVTELWARLQAGLRKYRSQSGDVPAAIGVDGWGVDFGLIDEQGRLIDNPYHYRDSRTDGVPELVFERIDERELFARTGVQTMQINTLFQLCAMAQANDPQLKRASALLMIPDLFHYFLCGAQAVEYSEATTTQMFSPRAGWLRDLLHDLGLPINILPEVVHPGELLGPVRPQILRDTGFPAAFPVIAVASHDTASAVAAIPEMDENSAFISSGTWSLMGVESRETIATSLAFTLKFTNEGGAGGGMLLVKNLTGLWILQECMREWMGDLAPVSWTEITAMASSAPAFQCVLDVDAKDFRAPGNMPAAIAEYCARTGQAQPQSPGAMARCCFESLALKYRSVLGSLEALTERRLETIRIVGGGCLNAILCQMTADACDRPVVSGPVEASALGNIMLQAIATGHLQDVKAGRAAIADSISRTSYIPRRRDAWDEAHARLAQVQSMACAS